MFHCVLHHVAKWAVIPLIVVATLVASLWVGSPGLTILVGFMVGRALYWPIKMWIAASTIGSGWGKCWGEMIRLDVRKVSLGGNGLGSALLFYPLGMITLVFGAVIDSQLITWLGFVVAVGVGTVHMFSTVPAVVLFLGRSSHETNEFLKALRLRLYPLRITSLLKAGSSNGKLTFGERLSDYDNVRVGNADDWLEVVTQLAMITPILLLDCRQDSGALADEIKLLQRPVFAKKTLAIVGNDGRAEALDTAIARGDLVKPPPWQLLSSSAASTELRRICRDPEIVASLQTSTSAQAMDK